MVNDKKNAFGGEKQNKKSNGEQSDLCDLEQVTWKPQLQAHHCLTTWLQIWYHSLLWGDSIRKGADLEKQNCLFDVHPAVMGKLTTTSKKLDGASYLNILLQVFLIKGICSRKFYFHPHELTFIVFLGLGKNFRLLMQSCRLFCFFFSRPFHENFKFLKNCPYDFHKILDSHSTILHPKGPLRA